MVIYGHGVLWEPEKGKPAARFVNGQIDTSDSRIIELAKMAGFVESIPDGEYSRDELIEIAERDGIEIDKRWGLDRLKSAVLDG